MNLILANSSNIEGNQKNAKNQFVDVAQVIRNFTGVEQDPQKKSVLQQLLEPGEVEDSQKEGEKALQIAKRIARGASVTPEEKAFLMQVNPQLAQMAQLARQEGQRIKHALKQASSKEEQQTIVMQAYQQVTEVSKANEQFGMLLGEAVKAAIQEAKKTQHKELPEDMGNISGQQNEKPASPTEQRQEEILEQFYPEEWACVLDCKG